MSFREKNPKLPTAAPTYVATAACSSGRHLYGRAQRCLFPQPPPVAVGGHCLVGAAASESSRRLCARQTLLMRASTASAYGSSYFYWLATVACGRAHDRRLCAAAAGAWTLLLARSCRSAMVYRSRPSVRVQRLYAATVGKPTSEGGRRIRGGG
ncbi:hypothetical protein GW17_00054207 [Ensete ventricosum]|nr:hypothetical protein GW17_00054207 [Ensete ventricosum]